MATVNFLVKGNDNPATIYLRFKHGTSIDITRSTDFLINPKDWYSKKGEKQRPIQRDGTLKNLTTDLNQLSNQIIKDFNGSDVSEINGHWLQRRIDIFRGKDVLDNKRSALVLDCIQYIINTSHTRENSKGNLGLSRSRVNSYKNLLGIFKTYPNGKNLKIKDIDSRFGKDFLTWLIDQKNYSESYARKKVDDLKTVCRDAESDGIEVNSQYHKIKGGKPTNNFVIYLNPTEIQKIKEAHLVSEKLQNARKWLLFGCFVGQRGGDLLRIAESNFVVRNGLQVIELEQQKTGKQIAIPILYETEALLSDGLPYYISIQKFNEYIKEVCMISGLKESIKGFKFDNEIKRKVKGTYPKYALITSHVCRRSFATNLYGVLPTPLIMQITAHSTEKVLLQYIGKGSYDYAQQIADFYTLQGKKKEKKPQLSIIRNVENK
jgi:integrase